MRPHWTAVDIMHHHAHSPTESHVGSRAMLFWGAVAGAVFYILFGNGDDLDGPEERSAYYDDPDLDD